jgi:hypothetical protein
VNSKKSNDGRLSVSASGARTTLSNSNVGGAWDSSSCASLPSIISCTGRGSPRPDNRARLVDTVLAGLRRRHIQTMERCRTFHVAER